MLVRLARCLWKCQRLTLAPASLLEDDVIHEAPRLVLYASFQVVTPFSALHYAPDLTAYSTRPIRLNRARHWILRELYDREDDGRPL